ncbi:LysR family transcriptional regulator [Pseudomonas antarctica]|uniref:LysR family transcriptional regulator n=1 Tax=Pseudomonas antarctica TaxID=219572 RepID=UPI003F74F877
MIETRLLRQFIAVAQELHFHKAAIRLHMAQPALSQAINRLEGKLGFSVFLRDRREVRLTPAGSAFLETAYRTLSELETGVVQARQVADGVAGTLTVTTISIAYYASLLNTLRQFRDTLPEVQLILQEMPSARQAEALVSGQADIAFLRTPPLAAEHIQSRRVLEEAIVMALPLHHPKVQDGEIDLHDFAEEAFVFTPQDLGAGYHGQLIDLCEAAGFYPRVVQEAAQIHTLIGLVACGFGVALVPESMAQSGLGDKVVFCRIKPVNGSKNPGVELYMSWNGHHPSPLVERFIGMLDIN